MSEDCIFCQIVEGAIPSYTVYEDDHAYAFLDANPLSPGHTLVIPKAHHERFNEMPADDAAAVSRALSDVVPAVETAVDASASTVALNNGEDAGQEVPHTHWHIIPQFADRAARPIHVLFDGAEPSDEELETIAGDIRDAQ